MDEEIIAQNADDPVNVGATFVDNTVLTLHATETIGNTTDNRNTRLRALEDLTRAIGQQFLNMGSNVKTVDYVRRFLAHNPPIYSGFIDPAILESWIWEMEKLMEVIDCLQDQRVKMETMQLRDTAYRWLATVKTVSLAEANFDWEAFKKKLRDRFYPETVKYQKQ